MGLTIEIEREIDPNLANDVREAQRRRMETAADRGFAISQERVPVDRGTLMQSGTPPQWVGDRLVWGYGTDYAVAQEEGTGPMRVPFEDLLAWAHRQGKGEQFAAKVQVKIAEEGVEAKGYAKAGAQEQRKRYQQTNLDEHLDL